MRLEKARVLLQNLNYVTQGGSGVPREVIENMNVFNKKQKNGTIDVWWLYDDGGKYFCQLSSSIFNKKNFLSSQDLLCCCPTSYQHVQTMQTVTFECLL
jgi:solute carrier family 12 (sodium/potassium/chloride transporter), member 2